jgi:hypothetical protein
MTKAADQSQLLGLEWELRRKKTRALSLPCAAGKLFAVSFVYRTGGLPRLAQSRNPILEWQ